MESSAWHRVSKLTVRGAHCRASLVAVLDAEALLLAFAMKLRISAGAAGLGMQPPQPGSSSAAALRLGNALAGRAADFLGQCLPDGPGTRHNPGLLRVSQPGSRVAFAVNMSVVRSQGKSQEMNQQSSVECVLHVRLTLSGGALQNQGWFLRH